MKLLLLCVPAVAASVKFTEEGAKRGVADNGQSFAVAFADVDADGDQDMFITNSGSLNRLYINTDGKGTFKDTTAEAGLTDSGESRGTAFADVNGDGALDLYVASANGRNHLYIGDGHGNFEDGTLEADVGDRGMSQGVCFADVDGDGDLDLFVVNGKESNNLYVNNGYGIFEKNSTANRGLTSTGDDAGFGCTFGDIDGDGDLDLYVTNSGQHNKLYLNDGKGFFTDVTDKAGVAGDQGQKRAASFADLNGDGHLDLFYVGPFIANRLFLGDGSGKFADGSAAAGIDLNSIAQGMNIADIDGDGDLDIFVSIVDNFNGKGPFSCNLFQNDGKGHFTDIAHKAGVDFFLDGQGVAFGDIDGDGDLDMYVETWAFEGPHQTNKLLINQGKIAQWLKVRPLDEHGKATLIGTEVWVYEAGTRKPAATRAQVDGGSAFASQNAYDLYFGLSASQAKQFDIEMHCHGALQTKKENAALGSVAPNQIVQVKCAKTQTPSRVIV